MTRNTFTSNSAENGGVLWISSADITVQVNGDSYFSNVATSKGGVYRISDVKALEI